MNEKLYCPKDESHAEFECSAIEHVTWTVDRNTDWIRTGECYDARIAEGTLFHCAICGAPAEDRPS